MAYEAATADLHDVNMIDPFHLEACGETAVNYNRDVEAFPVLRKILERITGGDGVYRSPTEMGVNRAACGILDDQAVQTAARQEVIRRYFRYACEYAMGFTEKATVERVERLMETLALKVEDRSVVVAARRAAVEAREKGKGHKGIYCGAALELNDGAIVTGKNSPLLHAASATMLNAVKRLAGLPDAIHLLSPNITEAIGRFKHDLLGKRSASLDLEETLIGLAISGTTNPTAQLCLEKLKELRGCDIHMTHIPSPGDEAGLRRLGLHLTSDASFSTQDLFAT